MPAHTVEDVKRLWVANQRMWDEKIQPQALDTLDNAGGLTGKSELEIVIALSFGRALDTFRAVQDLCTPGRSPVFFIEAFILTRTLFESYITIKWILLDPNRHIELFMDEFALKRAHMLDNLSAGGKDQVKSENKKRIYEERDAVLKKHHRGEGTIGLAPKIQEMARLVTALKDKGPGLAWEYEVNYRDVSGVAHLSSWGLLTSFEHSPAQIRVEPVPDTGYKALLSNGAYFLRLLQIWNDTFKVLPEAIPLRWFTEWEAVITAKGKE